MLILHVIPNAPLPGPSTTLLSMGIQPNVIPTCADCLPWTNIANMSTSMLAYKHDRLSIPMILILKWFYTIPPFQSIYLVTT